LTVTLVLLHGTATFIYEPAGLLTYFHSGRLPDYKTSGQGIVRMFKSSQQRGLSGILTRFPFNPPPGKRDKRSLLQWQK